MAGTAYLALRKRLLQLKCLAPRPGCAHKLIPKWLSCGIAMVRQRNGQREEMQMQIAKRVACCGMKLASVIAFLVLCVSLVAIPGYDKSPAHRPPMGWNSWDSYGTAVREEQVKA